MLQTVKMKRLRPSPWNTGDNGSFVSLTNKFPTQHLVISFTEQSFIQLFTTSLLLLSGGVLCIKQQMDISIRNPWLGYFIWLSIKLLVSLWSLLFHRHDRTVKAPVPPQWTLLLWVKLILNNDITSTGSILLGWRVDDGPGKLAFISMINWRRFGHMTAGEQPQMCMQFCVCVRDKHGQ